MLRGHTRVTPAAAPPTPLILLAFLLLCLRPAPAADSGRSVDISFPRCDTLTVSDTTLTLSTRFVVPGNLVLFCDGTQLPDSLYRLDTAAGILQFHHPPACGQIIARYRAWPFAFPLSYSLHPPLRDIPLSDSAALARRDSLPPGEQTLGGGDVAEGFRLVGFDIRGAKSVSVSGGGATGGTLLDQNLMLEVSGKLSPATSLSLRLNDQNLPLSPEGRSTELRQLDEVAVRLTSPYGNVSLGDYDFRLEGFRFARVERKLDGVAGEFTGGGGNLAASAALSGGTFNSLRFNAQEGRQGPYQLTDKEGAPARVLAGTERVYLDGNLLSRGLRADYTLDYTQGTLYFTERHLLGAESRIEIDYEYTSLSFKKSFYSLTGGGQNRWGGVRSYIIRESDLESSPLGQDFTPEEQQYLSQLGVSADSLQFAGVRYLGPGKGLYRLHGDNSAGGSSWFEFMGAGRGDYMLTFRDAGDYRGSYVFDSSTGGYTYVGLGSGNFEPIGRFSPPQRQDRAGAAFELKPLSHLRLEGEGAVLRRELNLFSGASLPAALAHSLGLHLDTLSAAGLPARLSLWGAESRVDRDFSFQGRRYGPDFERSWHLAPLPSGEGATGVGETQRESGARLDLPAGLAATIGWGELTRSSGERADRRQFGLELQPERGPLSASWQRLNVHSQRLADSTAADGTTCGYRKRDNLEARAALGLFTPRFTLEREELTGPAGLYDNASGERHLEFQPRLGARLGPRVETSLSFYRRNNDYLAAVATAADWRRESTVQATEADFSYQGAGAFRLSGRLGHRSRDYERYVQARTSSDAGRVEMFAGSFAGALQSHLLYDISHGSSVLSQVRYLPERYPDEGEYLEDGTYVGREQGTYRREVVVGGIDSVAAAHLSLTSRENLDLTAWIDSAGGHIKRMTMGSTVQLERENTQVPAWKLYLLVPSALADKNGATMRSTLVNTDLTVQWTDPGVYSRLELLWNTRFDRRFQSGYEETGERLLRLQLRIPLTPGFQWDPTPSWDRRLRTDLNGGSRDVRSLSLENRLTWDLTRQWRLGAQLDLARHRVLAPEARYGRYTLGGTLTRFLGGSGRLEAGARAYRVTGDNREDFLLVDILGLARTGTGYEVTAGASVEPAERMQLHLSYTGRTDYLRRRFVNYGRAEIKYLF